MSLFQSRMQWYCHAIIRRSQGRLNPFETIRFIEVRNEFKQGVSTFQWLLMGMDGHVINTVMEMGDEFLRRKNIDIALEFYREARFLFPYVAICCIREALCYVIQKCFDQAKRCVRTAIRWCTEEDFNELFSIIDIFIENDRLHDACELYISLLDKFPHQSYIVGLLQEVNTLIRTREWKTGKDKTKVENQKRKTENKKKKTGSKGPKDGTKATVKNTGQTNNELEKLGEASGGIESSEKTDVAQETTMPKEQVKTSKQLKREQMARDKEIAREIEKAKKEQEEKLKKQKEVQERKRREREEKEEKLRKEEEVEARRRQEIEEHAKKLEKQNDDKIKKQQEKSKERTGRKASKRSGSNGVVDRQTLRSKGSPSTNAVQPKKVSLDNMSTAFDKNLSSGSHVRRVCPSCKTPRAFSCNVRSCHSCRSELVVWYRKNNTTCWTKPRMPPNQDVVGPYLQCKHFLMGKACVKTPCKFAHGDDELEIWDLLRGKSNGRVRGRKATVQKSSSYSSLNGHGSGSGLRSRSESLSSKTESPRSRTESMSSQRSAASSSNQFNTLYTEDTMLDEFDSDSEYSSFSSQHVFGESSQDWASCTSSLSLNIDVDSSSQGESSPQDSSTSKPAEPDQSDDGWIEVGRRSKSRSSISVFSEELTKGSKGGKKKTRASSVPWTTGSHVSDTISSVMEEQKLRCNFCNITFSSLPQLEYHYSDRQHKVNVVKKTQKLNAKSTKFRPPPDGVRLGRYRLCYRFGQGHCYFGTRCTFAHGPEECAYWTELYQIQTVQLTQLENERLLTESLSEKVRRRIQNEGSHVVKDALPGVSVRCSTPCRVELDRPMDHVWIFDVRIETKFQLLLSEVSFLFETHLDKFKFLGNSEANFSPNMQSIRFLEEDFVEDSAKQESAVQFCVQFSSEVFGDFKQKLVFDFGRDSILARTLYVSVVSKDISRVPSRSTYCHISEWSVEKMELVRCKELMELDSEGVCDQYSIPNVLPDPSKIEEFKRETYCKLWHDILSIEEQHIQMEVARYDIQNGTMKIVNSFHSTNETVFAQQGELFGEIYLSDYLVMDEVAGHLINRSVMSVIIRPRVKRSKSKKVYECYINLKTFQLIIIKLNEALLKDYAFQINQEVSIDVKFKYNRVPICEMHKAVDLCKQKTEVLLPKLKNVSYKFKKSISDWFMGERKPNTNQHEAIAMILDPSPTPPILVIGPFGTGKTFTLSLACESILSQSGRNKVLICTHSNSAADIHLDHLNAKKENKPSLSIQPLRVLNLFRKVHTVPQNLRKYCLIEESTNVINAPMWMDIHEHNVIITTLATARMLWKFHRDGKLHFTHILIDEAAQALEPECLTPLVMADEGTKIVLAGDHKQMGPRVYSKNLWAEDVGQKRSLLERLFFQYQQYNDQIQPSPSPDQDSTFRQTPYVVLLTENYRSHAKILEFPSDCFYGGELVAKGDQSTHDMVPVLSFYSAQGVDDRDEGSLAYYNDAEVAEVVKRVEELSELWPNEWKKKIGVLTPYRDQVKRIRDGLRKKRLGYVDVETVENVQGKEFKALFISTVRTMWTCSQIEGRNSDVDSSELDFGFLSDPRFLNTAVTRAQSLLAVVGDPMSLCSVGACRNLWKDYLKRCDAAKGLYGCTLKTVMDFCLRTQALDPSAHEFIPIKKVEASTDTSTKGDPKVSREENGTGIKNDTRIKPGNGSVSIKRDSPSTSASPNIQPSSSSTHDEQDHDGGNGMQVDGKTDLAVSIQTNHEESVTGEDENDAETNQSATDDFFRRDDIDNYDKIIEVLVKACQETKKRDKDRLRKARNEHFPPLNDVTTATASPHWPNISTKKAFSAGFKDGRIELGFHVKESETLFRLTGGRSSFKENGNKEVYHDIEAFPQEELLKLLRGDSNLYIRCTFRKDTSSRQQQYRGELPTPDSPDIHIPGGRVRGVQEDDIVVLELQPIARARDEKQQDQVLVFGYIKGILRRLIEPKERQFVCTVDRANPGVMIPINKSSPKLMNFTKTDEDIIPIYTLKGEDVTQATILSKKHYGEALAGERVFVVKYLKWRLDCPYPLGLAVRQIPHGKDFKTGMEILYEEHNVRRKFSKELRTSVARDFDKNWTVPVSEKGRPVYRDNVFTIDPPESRDLDDAISIQSLGNGNFDLHVHIADVSYFVQPNTAIDEEANLRGTSYYPPKPDDTVPMLPRELSEDICSLLEGRDRLALTVSVEIKPDGEIVGDTRIARSIVRSSRRLTYLQAQKTIDETNQADTDGNGEARQIPVEEAVGVVHRIAQARRRLRLGFERSLYERKRDDCEEDIDNEREAHQMIEEIMVMANHLVAKYLLKKYPKRTPLRVQPPPKTRRVVEWRQRFQKFIDFSLGLEWLKDAENKHEETTGLKVPVKTWTIIMEHVRQNSNFEELVKLVCDLDLFPQLAAANVNQQRLQQRGQYLCSGETFEGLRYPWPQQEREAPVRKQIVHTNHVSSDVLGETVNSADHQNLPEGSSDHATNTDHIPSSSSCTSTVEPSSGFSEDCRDDETNSENGGDDAILVNEGIQSSANVSNQQDLNRILYGHSNLCLDAYCHFTSPIRRYIDVIVHRLLVASIENQASFLDPDDITALCDRCTFFARNSRRFDKDAKKLQLAVKLQNSLRFVTAFLDEIAPDALKLFFGTGEFELLRDKSVRIARLGPDKDPEQVDDGIKLQWTFRLLRLDKEGHAQPRLNTSSDEISQDLVRKLERQAQGVEPSDDDFDYTVAGEHWREVLDAVKNQNEDQLKSRLHEVDDDVQKQEKPKSRVKMTLVKRLKDDPSLSSNEPYQHPNAGEPEPSEKETDEFLKVTRVFKPFDRVKVQISSQMSRGVLSPTIQLFKVTNKIHACVEHRSFPTTCFAKTTYKRPADTEFSHITEYVRLWRPVLMMEIATSAVRENDVIILSDLRVCFARDTKGLVTMEFSLSKDYCKDHCLDLFDLNLMCVRVKDPEGSDEDKGYWVGHFQISDELRKKEDVRKILEEGNASTETGQNARSTEIEMNISNPWVCEAQKTKSTSSKDEQDAWPALPSNPPAPVPEIQNSKKMNTKPKTNKGDIYKPVLARLIQSSTPIPESVITQRIFYITVEVIMLGIPDRRRLGALVDSDVAPENIQDICIGKDSRDLGNEGELPKNLSLCNVHHTLKDFYPLNKYQRQAVQEALTKSFTLIQGPPGTGKTVTGVHIAYWFAQLNKRRIPTVEIDGEECNGSMVFYCGPSNKSVDVVARYLLKIPGLKILRVYGQEIERKLFPVPDKITLFRSRRVAAQLKADEDLKDVSLHHVIRSAECPVAEEIREYDEKFKEYIESNSNAPRKMIDEFNKIKSHAEEWAITQTGVDVILATCTSTYSPRTMEPCKGFYTQCIIDECGMCIEAETLCGMIGAKAKQVVLIGDHKQLQPIIVCDKAKDLGLGISMFERFSERARMLKIQYRMHKELCQFPSEFFYDGDLETAVEVLRRTPDNVTWPNGDGFPFAFHHVEGIEESLVVSTDQGNENSKKNQKEIAKVVHIARRLNNEGIKGEDIVILSPYRAQCFEITEQLKQHGLHNISVMSVIAAQGSEKKYVILSLVRSLPQRQIERNPSRTWLKEHLGFITDEHQINVALTRAKRGLCIVGNANLIGVSSMWRALLEHYGNKGCLMMDAK